MRRLFIITLAAAVLYGGYWFVGSRALMSGLRAELARMQAAGTLSYDDVALSGFPSRFDVTITQPVLRSPDGFAGWSAAFVQIFALSYRPNNIIAVWPNEQVFNYAGETVQVRSADMRASAGFSATTQLGLDHAELVGKDVVASGQVLPPLSAATLRAAIRRENEGGTEHRLGLALDGLGDGTSIRGALSLDARAAFDRPLDRSAAEVPPNLTALSGITIRFAWDDARLTGSGAVNADAAGRASGRIDLHSDDWRPLFALARDLGVIRPEVAPTFEALLQKIAAAEGTPEDIDLPLLFGSGLMSLGPVPLGPAPRFGP